VLEWSFPHFPEKGGGGSGEKTWVDQEGLEKPGGGQDGHVNFQAVTGVKGQNKGQNVGGTGHLWERATRKRKQSSKKKRHETIKEGNPKKGDRSKRPPTKSRGRGRQNTLVLFGTGQTRGKKGIGKKGRGETLSKISKK